MNMDSENGLHGSWIGRMVSAQALCCWFTNSLSRPGQHDRTNKDQINKDWVKAGWVSN